MQEKLTKKFDIGRCGILLMVGKKNDVSNEPI